MKRFFISILSVVCILFIANGCSASKQPTEEDPSVDESLHQLLESVQESNTFVFGGLSWFISKAEVIEQEQLKDIQIEEMDRIVVEGKLPLDASIQQYVIYTFEKDQLVSGEYLFQTNEKDQLDALSQKLKKILSESFPEPLTSNLDKLDSAALLEESNEQIMWKGEDNSYVRVGVLTNEAPDATLIIQITSPHPERNSLQ